MFRSFLDSAAGTSESVSSSESAAGDRKGKRDHRVCEDCDEYASCASSKSVADIVGDCGERENDAVGNQYSLILSERIMYESAS